MSFNGINGEFTKPCARKLKGRLLSRFSNEAVASTEFVIAPGILTMWLPESPVPEKIIPSTIRSFLADPDAHIPAPIDVLLGAGVWAAILQDGVHHNQFNIAFQPSRLGVLLFGGDSQPTERSLATLTIKREPEPELDVLLRRFWEFEEESPVRVRSMEQEKCEAIFMQTHLRLPDGRFQVNIPLRDDIIGLGSSRASALHRFHQLERRFKRDPCLRDRYFSTIEELMRAGHMLLANRPPGRNSYHIPHHAVLKKFRVVNDATCPTDRGISLNDVQLVGEKLQDDLADLIMRFRCYPVAITADIVKMFLQIQVNPSQWDLQRIFWRPSPSEEIKEYWLTRVTFGMASAPHCAVRSMIQCARDSKGEFPLGARAIEHDFYMDDCLTGARDEEEAGRLCVEMNTILQAAGFNLDKWRSNCPGVVPMGSGGATDQALDLTELEETSVLGLRWNPKADELMYKFQPPPLLGLHEATKRKILSYIAQIYDPNGYIGPVVIVAKMIMQRIWSAKIGWDCRVPDEIFSEWQRYQLQLPLITELRIRRWLGISRQKQFTLHGFADASTKAYGAVLYVRIESKQSVECVLVAAKSRVAPLKTITIPRLELCAAQLLSELVATFKRSSGFNNTETILWSDSLIVLAWLKKDAALLKVFVNNRVQKIQQRTFSAQWRHVPSEFNPADLLSRGASMTELENARLWWQGPEWLSRERSFWPECTGKMTSSETLETNKEEVNEAITHPAGVRRGHKNSWILNLTIREKDLLTKASSAVTLCRKTAWVFRFVNNVRSCGDRAHLRISSKTLTNVEMERALEFWIREEQQVFYAKEIKALSLSPSGEVASSSSIARFNPQLDNKGILRLHGRLGNALIPASQKNPALLPDVSHLAILLIREAHYRTMHGGQRSMTAYLRQKFWITNLRRAIRTNNSRCISCTKQRKEFEQQLMGELPSDRVRPYRAFKRSGVDYAGPFFIKARSGRCNILEKKYVAVFVCMVTKAVHLELAESLSADDFIQTFLNFTGIRGHCERLWSDNGKNFEGAERDLAAMLESWRGTEMGDKLQSYGTEWRFITPSAPHQGGLWEAAVKSMKYHLKRITGPHHMTSSQFRSVLIQISAVLNSRPISAISDDPDDLFFLTPAHFLIGESMVQPFGENSSTMPRAGLNLARQRQKMSQAFWKYWSQDYLNELQQRPKWQKTQPNLKPGDLVIVREDNVPPTMWKSGRVLQVFPGKDGLVRNVSLKMATADWTPEKPPNTKKKPEPLRRPVQKLCRLPVEHIKADASRGEDVGTDKL